MSPPNPLSERLRFAEFVLDRLPNGRCRARVGLTWKESEQFTGENEGLGSQAGELRRSGMLIKLAPQPLQILRVLAERSGEIVTREEIRQELWGQDTFVDFDGGLNFCINQIRKALRDNAESPRFIHTLPRRGYRFIASVEPVAVAATASEAASGAPSNGGHSDAVGARNGEIGGGEDAGGGPRARAGHL